MKSWVEVDERGAHTHRADGTRESIPWNELESVEIITTDEGPFVEDVYWVLSANERTCIVPGEAGSSVLEWGGKLPGWDYEAVIAAMTSTENARFPIWKRLPAE